MSRRPACSRQILKAESQHLGIGDRQLRVDEYRYERACGIQHKIQSAPDSFGEVGTDQITDERTDNDDADILTGADDR
jgi:hypothetical protein